MTNLVREGIERCLLLFQSPGKSWKTNPQPLHRMLGAIIPMTHTSYTGAINRLHFLPRFLARVSCKSWTGFDWYQIPAPIRTLFYSKPECGVHVTEMIIHDLFHVIIIRSTCNSRDTLLAEALIYRLWGHYVRRIRADSLYQG